MINQIKMTTGSRTKPCQALKLAAVRFLTRTFRNVFYVGVRKRYVRLWRSQRSRTDVWGG